MGVGRLFMSRLCHVFPSHGGVEKGFHSTVCLFEERREFVGGDIGLAQASGNCRTRQGR